MSYNKNDPALGNSPFSTNKNLSFGRIHGKIESGTKNVVDAEGVVDKKIGLFSSKIAASPSDGEFNN